MTEREICIDGVGARRCWSCGGRKFEPVTSLGSRLAHHSNVDSLQGPATLKCDRCGKHNRTGNAKNFTGPVDAKYAAEWAAEPPEAHALYYPPEAPREPPDEAALAKAQIELDMLRTTPPGL